MNKIIQGDCLEKLKELEDNSVDSIVTDPPYELGFMGKKWDNSGIAYNVELWKECLRVLKPGGHMLAFSGTRTYHRMVVAIEDVGFEVRDMIEWVYGSGFPKSLNVEKAINKIDGVKFYEKPASGVGFRNESDDGYNTTKNQLIQTGESSERAKQFKGVGTSLKPAHEPICMARKPLAEKTVAENCLKWGTGGINIDESRVGTTGARNNGNSQGKVGSNSIGVYGKAIKQDYNMGRFPANFIHDNSEEVRECFPETNKGSDKPRNRNTLGSFGMPNDTTPEYSDSGNASRFFKSIIYQAKASKSERNKGCEELPEQVFSDRNPELDSADVLQNRSGNAKSNFHPTVKPIALMEYLIKMVTPKGGVVLDPFAGSGTTLVSAKQNGFQYIGIEMTEEYIPIIEARLKSIEIQETLK